jgi:putative SOS response-associated peptidase YedK
LSKGLSERFIFVEHYGKRKQLLLRVACQSPVSRATDRRLGATFFAPRYNIAPHQQAPVIVLEKGEPTLKLVRWGLIIADTKTDTKRVKISRNGLLRVGLIS